MPSVGAAHTPAANPGVVPVVAEAVAEFVRTFNQAARPEAAYRAGFAVLAGSLLVGLAGWLLLPRTKA